MHWVAHGGSFSSLMLGRIELAQVSKARASEYWFYTLKFTQGEERDAYSELTETAAKAVCVTHALKVLA